MLLQLKLDNEIWQPVKDFLKHVFIHLMGSMRQGEGQKRKEMNLPLIGPNGRQECRTSFRSSTHMERAQA